MFEISSIVFARPGEDADFAAYAQATRRPIDTPTMTTIVVMPDGSKPVWPAMKAAMDTKALVPAMTASRRSAPRDDTIVMVGRAYNAAVRAACGELQGIVVPTPTPTQRAIIGLEDASIT
jgi:hypothetical protein